MLPLRQVKQLVVLIMAFTSTLLLLSASVQDSSHLPPADFILPPHAPSMSDDHLISEKLLQRKRPLRDLNKVKTNKSQTSGEIRRNNQNNYNNNNGLPLCPVTEKELGLGQFVRHRVIDICRNADPVPL